MIAGSQADILHNEMEATYQGWQQKKRQRLDPTIIEHRHASFYCTWLYCILQILSFDFFFFALFFNKLKVGGNFELSKSTGTFFPTAFAHFMSVSHFGNSHNIPKFAIIFLFVMVTCDQ